MIVVKASGNRLLLCRLAIGGEYYTVLGMFKFESVAKKYAGKDAPKKKILVRASDREWIVTSDIVTEDGMKVEECVTANYHSAKFIMGEA